MPFSADTLDFLFENRMHDSREWFAEHHDRYRKSVLEPLRQLVVALTPSMLSIDGELGCEPKVDRTICRIWRDTRYTHDPSLYRDNMWIIFKRGGRMHGTDYPGFYFDLSGSGFGYGCGFYAASTGYMNTLRGLILEGDPDYRRAQRSLAKCKQYEMDGDFYKRPHYPDRPAAERQWLERRNIGFNAFSKDFGLLFSDRLAAFLEGELLQLAPVYRFLLKAAKLEQQRLAALDGAQRQ